MITKRLLPMVVLAIGGLVLFGCANQTQIPRQGHGGIEPDRKQERFSR